jgi:hypothetical protein
MAPITVNSLDVLDDLTADLTIQLQLGGTDFMNSGSKGKIREEDQSDAEHALCLTKVRLRPHYSHFRSSNNSKHCADIPNRRNRRD